MMFLFVLALLIGSIYFSRYYVNTPLGWGTTLTIWLAIIKAPWFVFLLLWWVCWNASDEQWRHDYLITPLKIGVERFLKSA